MRNQNRVTLIGHVTLVTACVLGSLTLQVCAQVTMAVPGDPIKIDSGLVSGTMADPAVKMYLGIPFAAPPVRENRWRAPQAAAHWKGVLTANRKPAECIQRLRNADTNQYYGEELSGEDCLYLNIWEPASVRKSSKLPVVVYIYGGAFFVGSASMPLYGGETIARKGVIYVAANYRVGVFGFMAHPEATAESGHGASGNWGLLDQIAALKWVRQNIAAFGGDPNNVTLVGQSAGAMSISCLQASPLARRLFQRIIAMSGAEVGGTIQPEGSLTKEEQEGLKLQSAMKVGSLRELRNISGDKIFAMAQTARVAAGPVIDGYVLSKPMTTTFDMGEQNDVPLITGSTANDIGTEIPLRTAKTVEEYDQMVKQMFGSDAETILQMFPAHTDAEVKTQANRIAENSGFAIGARSYAAAQTKAGKQPAYLYLFTHVQPFTPGVKFADLDPATAGAYHTSDVPYWLGTYESFNLLRHTRDWTSWDKQLSDDMQDVIVSFAKTGNPSTSAAHFTAYDPLNEMRVRFGESIQTEKINSKAADLIKAHPPAQIRPADRVPAIDPGRARPVD